MAMPTATAVMKRMANMVNGDDHSISARAKKNAGKLNHEIPCGTHEATTP